MSESGLPPLVAATNPDSPASEADGGAQILESFGLWRSLLVAGLGLGAIALLSYQVGCRHGKRQAELPKSPPAVQLTSQASPLVPTRLPKETGQVLLSNLHHADPRLRRQAIWQLGQQGTTEAVQPLIDLMVNADSQQRSLILAAISEIGMRTLAPLSRALLLSLQDESAEVRQNAVRDITRVYDLMAQVSQVLRYATEDTDAEVRETAHWALRQLSRVHIPIAAASLTAEPNASEPPP